MRRSPTCSQNGSASRASDPSGGGGGGGGGGGDGPSGEQRRAGVARRLQALRDCQHARAQRSEGVAAERTRHASGASGRAASAQSTRAGATCYADGARFVAHRDNVCDAAADPDGGVACHNSRSVTAIMYLTERWAEGDEGELRLWRGAAADDAEGREVAGKLDVRAAREPPRPLLRLALDAARGAAPARAARASR